MPHIKNTCAQGGGGHHNGHQTSISYNLFVRFPTFSSLRLGQLIITHDSHESTGDLSLLVRSILDPTVAVLFGGRAGDCGRDKQKYKIAKKFAVDSGGHCNNCYSFNCDDLIQIENVCSDVYWYGRQSQEISKLSDQTGKPAVHCYTL